MRWVILLVGLGLMTSAPARADAATASPAPIPAPTPRPRLNLEGYVDRYDQRSVDRLIQTPRFESQVDVFGKAPPDRIQLTTRLRDFWLQDFDYKRGATSGGAPTAFDMRDFRHNPPQALNLMPAFQWLVETLKGRGEKNQ